MKISSLINYLDHYTGQCIWSSSSVKNAMSTFFEEKKRPRNWRLHGPTQISDDVSCCIPTVNCSGHTIAFISSPTRKKTAVNDRRFTIVGYHTDEQMRRNVNQLPENMVVYGRWPHKTNCSVLTESLSESSSSIDRIIASASVSPISSRIYRHNHIPVNNTGSTAGYAYTTQLNVSHTHPWKNSRDP